MRIAGVADSTAHEDTLARNAQRDREVTRALRKAGWRVVRVWECALTRARSSRTLSRIARAVCAPKAQPIPA